MSGFDRFLGNAELKARLKRDIAAGRLAHAYMIEGPRGSGKKTLAKLIAAAVACGEPDPPCMECVNCRKIMNGQSPDVITVEADKDKVQLGVDVIRRLRDDAVFAANDLDVKVYIFPEADTMNIQAQNALLKLLEEPPEGIMFLLLTENAQGLLPTIRSRTPLLRVEALDDRTVSEWLEKNNADAAALKRDDPKAFDIAVRLSGGSIGAAAELCSPESSEECMRLWQCADKLVRLLSERGTSRSNLEFHEYASKLASSIQSVKARPSKKSEGKTAFGRGSDKTPSDVQTAKKQPKNQRAELSEVYSLIADAARDLIAAKLTRDFRPLFYAVREDAEELSSKFPAARLMRLADGAQKAMDGLSKNMNIGLVQNEFAVYAASIGQNPR